MKKPIQISIPTPCHENWDAMTPVDKGRFCASCQKTVFDFTNSSDREIASILKNTNNACGRFRATQLDRNLVVPKEKSTIWMAASAAVVSFLTIGNHAVSAQTPVNTEQHVSETDDMIGKVAMPATETIKTGVVVDEENTPIPGAIILNTTTKLQTTTDFDGNFSIKAKKGDILEISFVGMHCDRIIIDETNKILKIKMEASVTGNIGQDRTFFGRVFHSIGNWFKKSPSPIFVIFSVPN